MWNFVLGMTIYYGVSIMSGVFRFKEDDSPLNLFDIIFCVFVTSWGCVLLFSK
jgi:hypothetical protein